ncbi:MAG: helix-turn-helix domain-containing protein [Bacteroidota bacterium]
MRAALELFAQEGYDASSTSRIARRAGVSEGLIFRHFTNKKGLLDALMQGMNQKMEQLVEPILREPDARRCILATLDLPFGLERAQYDYWRLQYKLKWQKGAPPAVPTHPLYQRLTQAFDQLAYPQPAEEAQLLLHLLDSLAVALLRDELPDREAYHQFLRRKYGG